MDKLEQYLDQVCRGIGGPRPMRQHVRQELREHLLDAAARYKATGQPEDRALEQAIADFGQPDEVRSGLEEAHGHRLLGVVIDKALDWKEKTMRAKWLWTTWAHLALATIIVFEVFFITFNVIFTVPRFQKLLRDGVIDPAILDEQRVGWIPTFLNRLSYVGGNYATFWLLGAIAAVALFEWRVRGENKSLVRLSLLGTVAVALLAVGFVQAGALVIPYQVAAPALVKITRPWAVEQVTVVESALEQMEKAPPANGNEEATKQMANALGHLAAGPALASISKGNQPPTADELRVALQSATERFREVEAAVSAKDEEKVRSALKQFREAFVPIAAAARRAK
jgi:hypothetical protein